MKKDLMNYIPVVLLLKTFVFSPPTLQPTPPDVQPIPKALRSLFEVSVIPKLKNIPKISNSILGHL